MLKKRAPLPIQTREGISVTRGQGGGKEGGEISSRQLLPCPKKQSGKCPRYGGPLTSQVTSPPSLFVVEPVSLIPMGNRPEPGIWSR
jgi:hypothetical protein